MDSKQAGIFNPEFLKSLTTDTARRLSELSAMFVVETLLSTRAPKEIPQIAGKKGEEFVADILRKIPDVDVKVVSSSAHAGDIVVSRQCGARTVTIMIDVKRYSNPVPLTEYQKFMRDIAEQQYDAAMMISLGTKFVGFTNDLVLSTKDLTTKTCYTALLNSTNETLICNTVSYVLGQVCVDRQIIINQGAVERLHEVRSYLHKISNSRQMLSDLLSHNVGVLGKISESLVTVEVTTGRLLDEVLANIDVCKPTVATADDIKRIKEPTRLVVQESKDVKIDHEAKKIWLPFGTITIMAKTDKIDLQIKPEHLKLFEGHEYSYKSSGVLTVKITATMVPIILKTLKS